MSSSRRIGQGWSDRIRGSSAIVGLLLAASLGPVGATEAGIAVPREEMAARSYDPTRSAGLFVGIRKFGGSGDIPRSEFNDIPYAVDDAIDLAHLFTFELDLLAAEKVTLLLGGEPQSDESRGFRDALKAAGATVLTSANQSEIYRHLSRQAAKTDTLGMLVVFLATHGFSEQGNDFLVAADSFEAEIAETGVPVAKVLEYVADAPAPRRLVFVDACRERLAPTRGGKGDPMSPSFAKAIQETRGQVAMSATVAGGYAYDHDRDQNGVFSAAIIRGLRGAAEADAEAFITVKTLADYVDEEVREWVKLYRPKDVDVSTGIAVTSGEWQAIDLPLAVHPERSAYLQRVEKAHKVLGENLGKILNGRLVDDILAALDTGSPCPAHNALLAKIEVLAEPLPVDQPNLATEIRQGLQRNLVDYFGSVFLGALKESHCAGVPPLQLPRPPPPPRPETPRPPPPPPRPLLPRVPGGPSLVLSIDAGESASGLTFWREKHKGSAGRLVWRVGDEGALGQLVGTFRTVRFSPRARYLVGAREGQIYFYDLRRATAGESVEPRLLDDGGFFPAWSRDGSKLAWIAGDSKSGYKLVTTRVNGIFRYRRFAVLATREAPQSLAWESEGGKRLALTVRDGHRHKIILVPAAGGDTSLPRWRRELSVSSPSGPTLSFQCTSPRTMKGHGRSIK